ncbi:MAG: glycosidase [Bacteroidota bacterium]
METESQRDWIVFSPKDVDLNFSPIQKSISADTFVLGAFNPGFTTLPNGNLLMMVRVAEALKNPKENNKINYIRWCAGEKYIIDSIPVEEVDLSDPRKFRVLKYKSNTVYILTSFSWLLPVELSSDGKEIIHIHYDKVIESEKHYHEFGIEDARITRIENKYYMTTCGVSSDRQNTTLYSSEDGLNYKLEGMILDHQNKDMVLFPQKIKGKYCALSRPWGDHYFMPPAKCKGFQGAKINLSESPDLLHWKPYEKPFLCFSSVSHEFVKFGAGAAPILTNSGWLIIFHGVKESGAVGQYITYWALFDKDDPSKLLHCDFNDPLLNDNPSLTDQYESLKYLSDVVFTTGVEKSGEDFIIASGELDLCCRLTLVHKNRFNLSKN